MKSTVLAFALVALSLGTFAQQTAIPNGNFESWKTDTVPGPKYYESNSNRENFRKNLPFNVVKSTDAYHGSFALKMTTVLDTMNQDTSFAYAVIGNSENEPNSWHGGIPYNQKPLGIRGYYKSAIANGDSGLVVVAFSKNGLNIGTYAFTLSGTHSTYTLFDFTLEPALTQTPDSMMLGFTSSNAINEFGIPGSMLMVDSVSLTGVTSQPAQLNGDYEEWEFKLSHTPLKWYGNDSRELADFQTTTAYKGAYAVKLKTHLGDRNNMPSANPDHISTGYYPRDCNPCNQMGGYPFTSTVDTVIFWYKYTSAGGSIANAYVSLRKDGNNIWSNNIELNAASTYTYGEISIQGMSEPDTMVIEFQSSRWEDTLVTHVGAELYIDEVQLKSQPLKTGIRERYLNAHISVFPNPAKESVQFSISSLNANDKTTLKLINIMGQTVYSATMEKNVHHVSLADLLKGVYFYVLETEGERVRSGKLIVE